MSVQPLPLLCWMYLWSNSSYSQSRAIASRFGKGGVDPGALAWLQVVIWEWPQTFLPSIKTSGDQAWK